MQKYIKRDFHVTFCDVPENETNTLKNNRNIEDTYIVKNVGYAKIHTADYYWLSTEIVPAE